MNNFKAYIFHTLIVFAIIFLGFSYGALMSFKDFEPIVSVLQNTSAMVFTIMGIWVAYLYPNAIFRITQPSKVEAIFSGDDEKRIGLIVGTIVISAAIMGVLILFLVVKPIIAKTFFYAKFPACLKCMAFTLLLILSYVQVFAIYIVIVSNVNFIIDLRNKRNAVVLNEKLR